MEIPGYRILRQLGRGGMATVYLATQESVQRHVALKVMSPSLLADPDFSERFLREARIAAGLVHRHVVGIHDVARSGDYNYIAMEYLGGGAVTARDGPLRPEAFTLRVVREIATALHYAHGKGVVHRDVKPDNILLREDGSSALTDFGIARVAGQATRMTRTGAVIGTPRYMSPEQARGRVVDGRADLYSLGVVLYELLIGRVPYVAEDSLAVGIMHVTEPVPVLPERLAHLQPLIDRLLAKQPEDRFQTGQQAADAIARIEQARAEPVRSGERFAVETTPGPRRETSAGRASASAPPAAVPALPRLVATRPGRPSPEDFAGRDEPRVGDLDALPEARAYRPQRRASARKSGALRLWLGIVLLAIVLAGAAAHVFRDRLRDLLANDTTSGLVARAQQALAAGKLVGTQGDSAYELFAHARGLDPDNDAAREGLNQLGSRLLDRADAELARSDLDSARRDLASATEILGGGSRLERLKSAIDAANLRGTHLAEALQRAGKAFDEGRLTGTDGAVALYRQALDADAGNTVAQQGLDKAIALQAQRAREALAAGDAGTADARIEDLARMAPSDPVIPELRTALAQLRDASRDPPRSDDAGPSAQADHASGAQVSPAGVPRRDPDDVDARARAGMRAVALQRIAQANAALGRGDVSAARAAFDQAQSLFPGDAPELRTLRQRLREAEAAAAEPAHEPSLADRARIDELLAQADGALAAGMLMEPDGAYDKYKAVLRIDGDESRAIDGLNRIVPRARTLFETALGQNRPDIAHGYLLAIENIDPGDAGLRIMSARLANAFLDRAETRLREGRREDARRAFDLARELAPANPRNAAVEAKILGGMAGG